jgi:thiol-disulfide isomerase/thioredoxin
MGRQTHTARRTHENVARQRAAAQRQAARRRVRRLRLWIVIGSAVGVLGVVGAIVAIGVTSSSSNVSADRPLAAASVVNAVNGVPAATLDAVGAGTATTSPKPAQDAPLTAGGKPLVLYVGAEFCPYCAAERWTLVQALSRFGAFTGLKSVRSSPTDVHPNTPTFSFYGASYSSSTLAFTGRELETVAGKPLDSATATEARLWHQHTGTPGSFPFVDIAGQYVITGPSYDADVLHMLSAQDIASALADPNSPVAKAIDGSANVLTAAICAVTNGQPASTCSAAGVTAAASRLHG